MVLFDYPAKLPDSYVGHWGPVTATIDWCEENYIFTPYIAEVVNSFTNFIFVALAMGHLWSTFKNNFGSLYVFISIGFASVGIGSFLFHMTLRYEYQLMDELPMVYVTALPFGYIFSWNQPRLVQYAWRVGTFAATALFTYIYIYVQRDPAFHQIFYAILNFGVIYKTIKTIQSKVTDPDARKTMYKMLVLAVSLFIFGFFIWNLDFLLCPNLRDWRRNILGFPMGVVTEGHGWWHIFTGLGVYYFIIYNQLLHTWMIGQQDKYKLVWHGIFAEVKLQKPKNE